MELKNQSYQTIEMLNDILSMDDKIFEEGFDDLMKLFEMEESFEQAVNEKIAYCRANNLTVDDLLEENKLSEEEMPAEFKSLSESKQKFISYLLSSANRINDLIITQGLHPVVNIRVEKLPHNEKLPAYAHEDGDSGLDVYLTDDIVLAPMSAMVARTGIKVAIPLGYEIQVRPRSGMSLKSEYLFMFVANSPGTIDANYREEVGIILKNLGPDPISIPQGTRIAQLVCTPVVQVKWIEVNDINRFPSDRSGGFGSTGVN